MFVLPAEKMKNTFGGGDFSLRNETTTKFSCNKGDWGIEGIFVLTHLGVFDYFLHGR